MKDKTTNFMQGVIALLVSQITIKILGMIYSLYLTNKSGFGDEGNAIFYSAYQIYIVFLTVTAFGIPSAVSKVIAEELAIGNVKESKRILKVSIFIFGLIGFIGAVILYFSSNYIALNFLKIREISFILKILAPSIFWITIVSVLRGYFNAKRKINISAKVQTIEQILKTLLTLIFVEIISRITHNNTEIMVIASTISLVLASVLSFVYIFVIFLKNEIKDKSEYLLSTSKIYMSIKEILKRIMYISIPITISTFLVAISKNIDSFTIMGLLRDIFTENEVKRRYGILTSKVELLTVFPTALNGSIALALIPEIARINRVKNDYKMRQIVNFTLLLTLFISIPIMFLMSIYSNEIISFLYPNANSGAELLRISSFSIVCLCLIQTLNGILQGLGKAIVYIKATIIGILIKFILNILLIPIEGIYEKGAIISTIISDIVICSILIYKIIKKMNIKIEIGGKVLKILVSIFLSIFLVSKINLYFLVEIILSFFIYLLLIFLLKVFNENDIKRFPNGEKITIFLKKIKIY